MRTERIYLKDFYPFIGEDGKNPAADMYLPYNLAEMDRQNDKRPAMIVCPGGAYGFCSEREGEPVALKLLDMGFNVFVLHYSCAPHRYPSQLIETAALFDYINKNADELNCDTERIGIIGFSAGGHLVAHYSNLWDDELLKSRFGATYKPAASVLCYPVISVRYAHRGTFVNLLGDFPETQEDINRFSCEKLVGKQTPPTFLFHTAQDTWVPPGNSICYAEALSNNGIPFELHIYPFGSHGISTADKLTLKEPNAETRYTSDWLLKMKRWLSYTLDMGIGGI